MKADSVRQLFRFIDWLMDLPEDLNERFSSALRDFEQEKNMPYVTSVERLAEQKGFALGIEQGVEQGIEKGIEKGIEQGIESLLRLRFGDEGLRMMAEIRPLSRAGQSRVTLLSKILREAETVKRLEDLRRVWQDLDEAPAQQP